MRTVLLASLRTHARRYAAALLAVGLGAVFIVVTAGLSSAVRSGLVAGIEEPYAAADVVLDLPTTDDAVALLDHAESPGSGAEAWIVGGTRQPVAKGGDVLDTDADLGQVATTTRGRWQELVSGRLPAAPGEVVVDAGDAETAGLAVGDPLRIGSGNDALDAVVVGTVDAPSIFAESSVYLLWADLRRWEGALHVDSIAWSAGGDAALAGEQVHGVVPDIEVLSVAEFVDRVHTEINNEVDVISVVVLLFASIALVVGVLVVANTFSILFAQRSRELALLRCIGATRRQVVRSVRVEALAVGVLAAVLGVLAGVGLAHALVAVVDARWPDAGLGAVSIGWQWMAGAAVTAVLVTITAAWLPTRRVLRVGPLAALGPDDGTSVRTRAGRARLALGAAVGALGAAGLVGAVAGHSPQLMVVGGTLAFSAVLLWGPVLVPALVRLVLLVTGRVVGPAGRLAAANAVRNPRRTAATTASLLIGVTLTTAVLTGLASSRTAVDADMDRSHPLDLTLTAGTDLPTGVADAADDLEGVRDVVSLPGTTGRIGAGSTELVLLAPGGTAGAVLDGRPLALPDVGTIMVPWDLMADDLQAGAVVHVRTDAGSARLRVVGAEGFGESALVAPETLARLAPAAGTRAVWLRAADGADDERLGERLEALAGPVGATVTNDLVKRAYVDLQLDVLTGGVVGLLGISILIALAGIGNTIGLSVAERAREHALLRALGLTRRQLRLMLAGEASLLSVAATLLGTTIGVLFAWVGVQTLVATAVEDAALTLPWGQLAVVLVVSAVAGVAAAILPSRRAARIAPAVGLAAD